MLPKHRSSTLASLVTISGLLFRPRTRMRFGLAIRNTVPPSALVAKHMPLHIAALSKSFETATGAKP